MKQARLTASHSDAGGPGTRLVNGIDKLLVAVSLAIAVSALVAMFISLLAEVAVRYLTNQGLGWPTELPSLLFPWLVMGGVVVAAQRGQHIAVTALQSQLGRTGNRLLLLMLQVIVLVTFFYLAWVGLTVLEITSAEAFPVTGISANWAYLALVAGFVGLGITAITTFVRLLQAQDPRSVRSHHIEEEL